MSTLIQHSVCFDKPAMIDFFSRAIFCYKLYPCFIKIANLGNQGMADILILNYDQSFNLIVRLELECFRSKRGNHVVLPVYQKREEIYVQIVS